MIDLSGLNQAQYKAVTSKADRILCLAGAGTGKTRVLTHRVARLFHEGVSCGSMLALTFTRLAGVEMKERVISLIGIDDGKKLFCNTFHAFCAEVLQEKAHLIGFDKDFSIYDQNEQEAAVKNILRDLNYKSMSLKSALNAIKSSALKGTKEAVLRQEYFFRMKQNNAIDFDSLILFTIQLFTQFPSVKEEYRSLFKYVFVDEFQDTSDDQWELITLLQPENLFIVGDDFQSIYGWRNANVNIILKLAKNESYETIKLEENYRSTIPIVLAANTLIKKNTQTEKILRTVKDGPPITISRYDNVQDELSNLKLRIKEMVQSGMCTYRNICILSRTNKQLEVADTILNDIPHVVVNAIRDPMKSEDVKAVINFIEAVRNNENDSLIKKIICQPKPMFTDKEILQIEKQQIKMNSSLFESISRLYTHSSEKFISIYESIKETVEQYENTPLLAFEHILSAIFGSEYYTGSIESAKTEIAKWETRQSSIGEPANVGTMLNWLRLRDIQDKFSEDADDVKLMTVHASKGLEFETVFIVGMNQGIFPSRGDIEEERRLFYVAITRAKTNLFISRANKVTDWYGNEAVSEESQFLKEMQN